MPISFSNIPAGWRQPLYYVEVDPSKAGLPRSHQAALIVGQMFTPSSTVLGTPDVPIPIGRQMDADRQFGVGSMLARMFKAYFESNKANEVWALPVVDPVGGTAASGTITISTAPVEAGTIHLFIAGEEVMYNVAAGDTVNATASGLVAAINANKDLPVTAAAVGAVVTLTAKWKGTLGNDITMTDSYYGRIGGQELPVGLTLTYSGYNLAGGVGVPIFTNAIANMGEHEFDFIAMPYTDSTSLLAWEIELGFTDSGRWGWMRQLYGTLYSAKRGIYSDLIAFGDTRNAPTTSVMGIEPLFPSPVYEVAASYCAKAARGLVNDPARPLQTLHLEGMLPAKPHDRFNLLELNTLANTGIATQRTLSDNVPMISRETTTYQLNLYGQGDDAYELITTMATLTKLIRNQRHAITSNFPRHKLADDDTRFGPGQAIVTPKIIKAFLIAQYRDDEFVGLVENVNAFKANLIVERDPDDPNRLNVLYPPDLVNQLRIFAVLAQFRLQYDRGTGNQALNIF